MPVRFRGVSEYSSMYKWQSSFKSSDYQPHKVQRQPDAGLRSDEFNLLSEPGFSKKKQVPHRRPEAGDCLMWWQDNFEEVESERSFTKERNTSKPIVFSAKGDGDHIMVKTKNNEVVSVCKDVKPDFKQALDKSKSTWEKDKQSEYVQNIRKSSESTKEKNVSPKSKTHHNKRSSPKSNYSPKKDKTVISKSPKKENNAVTKTAKTTPTKPKPSEASATKARGRSPEKQSKANNRPLRYRPLHRRMLSAHQSEYQQMYKKPTRVIPSSPLISALDVVHSSSPTIPPHKSPKMLCKTEYATKFQNQSPLRKSAPVDSASSPPSPSMRLKVRDLPASPYVQRRSPRKLESEYADQYPVRDFSSNFKKRMNEEAQHNKLNREGSAFDKDHINQICSPTNKLWDLASVSASDEATGRSNVSSRSPSVKSSVTAEIAEQDKEQLSMVIEENEDVESVVLSEKDSLDTRSAVTSSTLNQSLPVARKLAWDEHDDNDDDSSTIHGSTDSKSTSNNGYEGRIPTPQLKKLGGALRSHHDLTTPSPGGALLTSPSSSEKKKRFVVRSASPSISSEAVDEKPVKLSKTMPVPTKTTNVCKLSKTAEVKRSPPDDSRARESNGHIEKLKRKPDVPRFLQPTTRAPIQGALRSQEFQHCGKHSRPSTAFDRVSLASHASIASADDLLQRSLQRRDFWKTS